MANAKKELLEILAGKAKIKCAKIYQGNMFSGAEQPKHLLKINHSEEEFKTFLKSLNFEYDNGYGGQELFGTVWLDDGTWLSRGEYDGSEWWEHNVLPVIPSELL